ncbi:MAG: hypothetical protein EZS28_002520 [Streblomastix strix]|uniref:Uncharacterized protein n=1 Tax=Streblomastix strix TaxID=222440 RepID=A0A5J4X5P8_9EUKA|nr:MAG: hypothetical protein EZS28_002520 [Streblomastix strix]
MLKITCDEYMVYAKFLSSLVSVATKAPPEIELHTTANVAYRAMGLIRLYCLTTTNYMISIEPKQFGAQNGLTIRYLFGKQVDINLNGTFTSSDIQPINVQQQTMHTALQDIKRFEMQLQNPSNYTKQCEGTIGVNLHTISYTIDEVEFDDDIDEHQITL